MQILYNKDRALVVVLMVGLVNPIPDPVPYGIMSWFVLAHHLTMLTTSSVVSAIVTTAGSNLIG